MKTIAYCLLYPFSCFFQGFREIWTGGDRFSKENLLLSTLGTVGKDREESGDFEGAHKCYLEASKIVPESKYFRECLLRNFEHIKESRRKHYAHIKHRSSLRLLLH